MPPKAVYGKRTSAFAASRLKYLSPDKDDVLGMAVEKKTRATSSRAKRNEVAEEGAESAPKPGPRSRRKDHVVITVDDVERELEGLVIEEKEGVVVGGEEVVQGVLAERDANKETNKRSKRAPGRPKKQVTRKAVEVVDMAAVDRGLEALMIKDEPLVEAQQETLQAKDEAPEVLAIETQHLGIKKPTRGRGRPKTKQTARAEPDANSLPDAPPQLNSNDIQDAVPSPPGTPPRKSPAKRKIKAQHKSKSDAPKQMLSFPTASPDPTPNNIFAAYVSPLLPLSDRGSIMHFSQWSSELDPHFEVTKFAEASFGEVYRLTVKNSLPNSPGESVLKIMAIKSPPNAYLHNIGCPPTRSRRNAITAEILAETHKEAAAREEKDEGKSEVGDIRSEVLLLQNLNPIPGFTNFRELTILQGRPSPSFSNAWKAWNKARHRGKKSVFPDPSKKSSYDETQLWAVIEMQDAGIDCERLMERGGISTIWEVWDVFWGVCLSVAKAEEGCRFEHRDLHLENVCIRSSVSRDEIAEPVIKEPLSRKLGFTGLETTVIDYTLSRADIVDAGCTQTYSSSESGKSAASGPESDVEDPEQERGATHVAYFDLNKDPAVFSGDASEEYQYEIYRYMRSIVHHCDPLQPFSPPADTDMEQKECSAPITPRRSPRKAQAQTVAHPQPRKDIWRSFHPRTNLIWMHFLLYKLLSHVEDLQNLPSRISTVRLLKNVQAPGVGVDLEVGSGIHKKAVKLEKVLRKVAQLLDPAQGFMRRGAGLASCKELVVLGIERGWVGAVDVMGA
ncbi:hypothetical protein BCR34DRAFT_562832 [Clohesyomyces aquaticus]|uniref:non-specific serine/threonine protein kinase n=1 Tax=Clohesyomyces aquaticus TaxID=1231657 RepID=A0A1Y1ZSY2_9PLEO|nr:hypothetical protein BCR34DRAFT_562832 [Clohesyomyces aquaticus]